VRAGGLGGVQRQKYLDVLELQLLRAKDATSLIFISLLGSI
jgi:hypothetical protein